MKYYLKTEFIKSKLKELGWTQKFLAKKSEISYSQLNRLIKNKYEPTYGTLVGISKALDCYPEDLVAGDIKRPEMIKITIDEYKKLKGE